MVEICRVSVIGVGVMGSAIARRLIDTGNDVIVFDLAEAAVSELVGYGATAAASPADAARQTDLIVLSLNTAAIVSAVVFGEVGIAQSATPNTLVIDMSSIAPQNTIEIANRLMAETGACWTDNPLSGGAPAVAEGMLTIMAGGSEADFERAAVVMDHLAGNRTHMGPVGAGQATKLINQMLVGNSFATLVECAELAIRGGVDPEKIPSALAGGRADSPVFQEFFVKIASRDYSPTGRIDNMLKDLAGAKEFADSAGVKTPLLDSNVELHEWLIANGHGPSDTAAMMEFHGPKESA